MSYNYEEQRPYVFSEEGQKQFLSIRDRTKQLIDKAGAASLEKMISTETGSVGAMIACVDRLVELGELRELTADGVWGQNRVFVRPGRD